MRGWSAVGANDNCPFTRIIKPHCVPQRLPAQLPGLAAGRRQAKLSTACSAEPLAASSDERSATQDAAMPSQAHHPEGSQQQSDLHSPQHQQQAQQAQQVQMAGGSISVRGMSKRFETRRGTFTAVDDVSLEMEAGSITALVGPSGSGKTTLLRLIAGLEQPTEGRVFFDGEDVTEARVQDRQLGIVFQGYALFKHMNVKENITFGPRMRKMDIDLHAKAQELLRLIELGELGGRYPPQLSGGQKQRVAVARALACNPKVMLMDEPFGALDPVVRKSLREGLRAIVKRLGVTTILVTHDQEEAWDLADRVVIFNRGQIEQEGTPDEVTLAPATPFVMDFIGETAHVPADCQLAKRMGVVTQKPYLMCRPAEAAVFREYSEELPPCCPATVADRVHMGWAVRYYLNFDDGVEFEFVVPQADDERWYDLTVGQRCYVRVEPSKFMEFDYPDIDTTPGGM